MKCTFLANCGLHLVGENSSILVDAPNGMIDGFDTTSQETLNGMMNAVPPYDRLRGLFFTHLHPDHYDKNRLSLVIGGHEDATLFLPKEVETSGVITAGDFTVHYFSLPHSGGSTYATENRVFLVECAGRRLYVCGDSEPQSQLHRQILEEYAPHAAIWNPNYVNFSRGRELLAMVERNYICHLPISSQDTLGIRRKCLSSFAQFAGDLVNTTCVLEQNLTVEI